MKVIWSIQLALCANGQYKVRLHGEGGYAEAWASTPDKAYNAACARLVIKPFLVTMPAAEVLRPFAPEEKPE